MVKSRAVFLFDFLPEAEVEDETEADTGVTGTELPPLAAVPAPPVPMLVSEEGTRCAFTLAGLGKDTLGENRLSLTVLFGIELSRFTIRAVGTSFRGKTEDFN